MNNNFEIDLNWGSRQELILVILLIFISGLIAKVPFLFNIDPELFYPRNIGTIVFPTLISYLSWRYQITLFNWGKFIIISSIPIVFINLFPGGDNSDTFILSSTHSLFLLLSIYSLVYVGEFWKNNHKRIKFLHYCGDLIIMSGLLLISGGLFTAITIGLFEMIGYNIEDFYFENIAIWGIPAIPILASYLIFNNKNLVSNISPVIAKIFTPLVFIILLIFSITTIFSDKNFFADRELLLLFNIIIIAVLALILFSLSHINKRNKFQFIILLSLSLICIVDNLIVLYAISSRLFEFGITPNRLAVTGLNMLVFFHLIIISRQLFSSVIKEVNIKNIFNSIGGFLPIYVFWTLIIVFLFPIIFNFK
ncbi:MAG: hypothetical protein ACJZ0Y_03480 [Cytophagales bacterium]|jgi:hypothetical protein